ncbi:monocarboxylate permease [Coprinopsis cinerea AmutBmut pab1-1]|nr:monocarboxylate permease [Coprinopsis cinerea AmutBmut pab1-1]
MKSKRDSEANSDETLRSSVGSVIEVKVVDVAESQQQAADEFPEGGLQAWLTVVGSFLIQYTTFGYINAFGVYQDFYVREYLQNSTPSSIGWIGGTQIFLNFSMGLFTGRAFDRGYFQYLMISSVILHAIALFMLSLSHPGSYYQVFLTNGVALGAACGITYIPSLGIVSHYFHRRRAIAIGIVSSGSALGAILHPIMLNRLFHSHLGFHNGVRVSACINVTLLVVASLIMRTRLPPKAVQKFPIIEWLKEPPYLLLLIAGLFSFLGLFFPVFYLQLNAITHGVDKKFAFYALSILNAASVCGRMIPNALAPKLGLFNLLVFFTTGTGVSVLCMAAMRDATSTALFAIFFGFCSGACIALVPATIGLLSKDMNEFGTRLGLFFGIGGVLGLFATPISGALLTSEFRWINAILFSGITLIISGLFYTISRCYIARRKNTQIL